MLDLNPSDEVVMERVRVVFRELVHVARFSLAANMPTPAKVILLSGIDIVASLERKNAEGENTGEDFKKWCRTWLVWRLKHTVNEFDLWGARCGVLHSMRGESRERRKGRAKMLIWSFGGTNPAWAREVGGDDFAYLDIESTLDAFESAVNDYLLQAENDDKRRKWIVERGKLFYFNASDDDMKDAVRLLRAVKDEA